MVDEVWPRQEDDFIEFGSTGLVPGKDGWFYNTKTGETISPDGTVYDRFGEIVSYPEEDDRDA